MENTKPLVIVLSRNYSTGLGVIRSLGAAGYTVDLIASTKKKGSSIIASCSKYVNNSIEVITPQIQGDTGEALMDVLKKYAKTHKEKMVLFPVDDFTASVIDLNRETLKGSFCMPEIKGDEYTSIHQVMDKVIQGELAREAGILTPMEWLVSLRGEITVSEKIQYPCFVKPLQSISGHKTEMAVCHNKKELENHLTGMKKYFSDRDVLVQEYLKIDKEYDLSGVCLDQEIILPGVIEKTRIAQYEQGVTMTGKMHSLDIIGEVKDNIIRFLKKIHYIGMFDMELCLCNGNIYFNEINFRSGGPNYFYFKNGVNLPKIFVEEILGIEHRKEDELIESFGKTFVYEKVAWEDYMHSYITKKELDECIKEADYTLLEEKEDPAPGKCFYKKIRLSAMKHKIKAMKRKPKKEVKNQRKKQREDVVPVIVVGRNYCNILTMTRALGEAGYPVEILRVYKKTPSKLSFLNNMEPDAYSKYVTKFSKCIVGNDKKRVIRNLIRIADVSTKRLLIPVDDYTASIIDESYQMLSEYYVLPNIANTQGEICRLMDKNVQKELAAQCNVPVLESVLIQSINGKFEIPESVKYPCFVKPNASIKGTKAGMKKCDTKEELEQLLYKFAEIEDFEMLVEEYAEVKTEYSLLGVSTKDGIIAPGLFKVIEGGHRERKGVTIVGESVDISEYQDIVNRCVEYIHSLDYTGLFDVDLIETKDGKMYFIELNFRAGASTHLFTKTGINLPGMLADYLIKGCPICHGNIISYAGKRFVSEKVLLEEFARSDIGIKKLKQLLSEADVCFIKDDKDPRPYQYFRDYYLVAFIMRIPYRIRDLRKKKNSNQ